MGGSTFGKSVGKVEGFIKDTTRYLRSSAATEIDVASVVAKYSVAKTELGLAGPYVNTLKERERYEKVVSGLHNLAVTIVEKGLEKAKTDLNASGIYMRLVENVPPSQYHVKSPKLPISPYAFQGPHQPSDPILKEGRTVYDTIGSTISRAEGTLNYVREVAQEEGNQTSVIEIEAMRKAAFEIRQQLESKAKKQ